MDKAYAKNGPLKLKISLGNSPVTRALRAGEIPSTLLNLEFNASGRAMDGFGPMVRDAAFDIAELPIITVLLAIRYGKPLVLFPAVLLARPQHSVLVRGAAREPFTPERLAGCRIGVSSYTRTTGVWVRGILQHEYGVDPAGVTWVCTEEPHLAEFSDPANVEHMAGDNSTIKKALIEGSIDAAILSDQARESPDIRPVIEDHAEAAHAWMKKMGITPINHVLAVDARLSRQRPDAVVEFARMLRESRALAGLSPEAQQMFPYGLNEMRSSLELAIQYSYEQGILSRSPNVDEFLDSLTAGL